MDFCSYLFQHLEGEQVAHIKTVIFFGSGARGEAGSESDADLFIEAENEPGALEKEIEIIAERFYKSVKYTEYWKLLGITYPLSIKAGVPEDWKSLYPSLLADGRVLYGKYFSTNFQGKGGMLFCWENIRSQKKRTNLYRTLSGYKDKGKTYPGLLEKCGAQRLSMGSILVPVEHCQAFRDLFGRQGIPVKEKLIMEV
jgi:predicted nucleotidyltransferase